MRIGIEGLGARHCAAKNRANRPLSAPPKLYEPRVHHRRFEHQKKRPPLLGGRFLYLNAALLIHLAAL